MGHEFLRYVYNENIYNIQDKFTRLFIKKGTMGGGSTQYGICIDENVNTVGRGSIGAENQIAQLASKKIVLRLYLNGYLVHSM